MGISPIPTLFSTLLQTMSTSYACISSDSLPAAFSFDFPVMRIYINTMQPLFMYSLELEGSRRFWRVLEGSGRFWKVLLD